MMEELRPLFDLHIGDNQFIYFANAHGRSGSETERSGAVPPRGGDSSEIVPENVRLDCYGPEDLMESAASASALASQAGNNNNNTSNASTTNRFDRIKILAFLGMVWEFPNEDYEEIWQKHFRDLLEYKATHGNCNVPQKGYGRLSWWVKIQRELYVNTKGPKKDQPPKKTSRPRQLMPQHRIAQLESVGFEWRIRPPALKWEERYKELIRYKKEVGDCNVPQNYPPNRVLGKWVMKQRGYYYDKVRGKKSPLNPDRQAKLEAIGFCWVAPHVAKTKAKLPLREDIIKEQLRARDVVATVVAQATGGGSASEAALRDLQPRPSPQNPQPVAAVDDHPQQAQLPSPQQQQQQQQQQQPQPQQHQHQQHHHPQHDVYHYYNQQQPPPQQPQQQPQALSYFGGPATTVGNLPHDPQQQPQPQHVGGLGALDGSILNHISPTEHYLARPLEPDHSQLQQQQQQQQQPPLPPQQQQQSPQSYLHHAQQQQQQQQQDHQQQQHGLHSPQEQQQQSTQPPPPAPMMFHPPQPLPQANDVVGSPPGGAPVPVAATAFPPFLTAAGVGGSPNPVGAGGDATNTPSPQQQQQPPTQQQQAPTQGGNTVATDHLDW